MAEEEKDEKKGGMMKIIIIAVVVLLLLAGVGVGAYILGSKGSGEGGEEEKAPKEEQVEEGAKAGGPAIGPIVNMEDFIVNILDPEGSRYLKASVSLELSAIEVEAEVIQRKPQIRDAILLLMSNKSFDELRDLQGKLQLRADLVGRINSFLTTGRVRTIYFTDFVVQ